MQKNLFFPLLACATLFITSCSKLGTLSENNFKVTPKPLETQGGQVPVTINGNFPEKYMAKKATVTVIPELRLANGKTVKGTPATFQGEKVYGNNQTISYRMGGHYTMKTQFPYTPEMQQSQLFMTFNAFLGKKKVDLPAVKVADGVIATSELYKQTILSDGGTLALDSFQRVRENKQEANIKFLVNQANLRQSELKNNSIKEFVSLLKRINADREQLNIRNVEVKAYASPEGGFEFNDKLANKRKETSKGYVNQQLTNAKLKGTAIDAHYTAQDWEGFQQLVQASNIQDKEVILRVLSMYKDPEEREKQIRNMSEGFRELADAILPELRRSRLIINYEHIGKSDDQIKELYASDPAKLDVEEMLYAATLETDAAKQEAVYQKAAQYFDKDFRAFNNLAALALAKGNTQAAESYLAQALNKKPDAPEANANMALLALTKGQVQEAENYLAKAIGANGFDAVMGTLELAKGNYAAAESKLADTKNCTAALAQLLNKNYAAAIATLDKLEKNNGVADYLHAIVAARQSNKFAAKSYLDEAIKKNPALAAYADKDLEFALLR